MFCYSCGTQFSGQYCTHCGIASPHDISDYIATYDSPKFCVGCGTKCVGMYCVSCGKSRSVPKISAGKKFIPAWTKSESVRPTSTPPVSYTETSGIVATSFSSLSSRQNVQYCLTAIFFLMTIASSLAPALRFGSGTAILNILLIAVCAAGIITAPLIANGNSKNEHYVYGATAGICLLIDIIALIVKSLPWTTFVLTLLPIAILGCCCLVYFRIFSLPPALAAFLDEFRGARVIWLFCVCYQVGYSLDMALRGFIWLNIPIGFAVAALISVAAWMLEKGGESQFKIAVGLLLAGCVLQLFGNFNGFTLIFVLLQVGAVVYIGNNVFSGLLSSIGKTGKSGVQSLELPNSHASVADSSAQPSYHTESSPARELNSHRGLLKFIFLNLITFGIYSIVFFSGISTDINVTASRYDGRKTMHYCVVLFLLGPITAGVAYFIWFHNLSSRIGNELKRRNILYNFGASTYWLWSVLGALFIIGPFVYLHKLAVASNKIAEHYKTNG